MMDIRCPSEYYKEFSSIFRESSRVINFKEVVVTEDNKNDIPIIMVKLADGSLSEWSSGYENVKSFLQYGYVKLIGNCPFRSNFLFERKCTGEKCQLYMIRNATGDCSIKWTGILKFDKG